MKIFKGKIFKVIQLSFPRRPCSITHNSGTTTSTKRDPSLRYFSRSWRIVSLTTGLRKKSKKSMLFKLIQTWTLSGSSEAFTQTSTIGLLEGPVSGRVKSERNGLVWSVNRLSWTRKGWKRVQSRERRDFCQCGIENWSNKGLWRKWRETSSLKTPCKYPRLTKSSTEKSGNGSLISLRWSASWKYRGSSKSIGHSRSSSCLITFLFYEWRPTRFWETKLEEKSSRAWDQNL